MNLSAHFTLEELTLTEHRNIGNLPGPVILPRLQFLAERLEAVREVVGAPIFVTSGYRSPELNTAVGGAAKSDHVFGLAADIRAAGFTTTQLFERLQKQRSVLQYRQLIWEFGRWVHVSFTMQGSGQAPKPPLQTLVIYPNTKTYLAYVPGETRLA